MPIYFNPARYASGIFHLISGATFLGAFFIAILMTILIQATTPKWLAKKLDLLVEE